MVHFRKRLGLETLNEINELICKTTADNDKDDPGDGGPHDGNDGEGGSGKREVPEPVKEQDLNQLDQSQDQDKQDSVPRHGKLILDATCAPADIRFPTDLSLLNEAREKLEDIIDILHKPLKGKTPKPRTYRLKACRDFLLAVKRKKHTTKQMRKAVGKQLRYVARDLRLVDRLLQKSDPSILSLRKIKELEVIRELYRQQKVMYNRREHRIDERIVSISQPHIRPIVRGKAKAETEFGAKVAISVVNGYAFIENFSWDNFNEGTTLKAALEAYRKRFGYYPEAVLADKIYRNRDNLSLCKKWGIHLSGPKLGRPSARQQAAQRKIERQDARDRNAVEGKFGEGKRHYGLGLIMARLRETSETVIALQFLIMNLEHRLRTLFFLIFRRLFPVTAIMAFGW